MHVCNIGFPRLPSSHVTDIWVNDVILIPDSFFPTISYIMMYIFVGKYRKSSLENLKSPSLYKLEHIWQVLLTLRITLKKSKEYSMLSFLKALHRKKFLLMFYYFVWKYFFEKINGMWHKCTKITEYWHNTLHFLENINGINVQKWQNSGTMYCATIVHTL